MIRCILRWLKWTFNRKYMKQMAKFVSDRMLCDQNIKLSTFRTRNTEERDMVQMAMRVVAKVAKDKRR